MSSGPDLVPFVDADLHGAPMGRTNEDNWEHHDRDIRGLGAGADDSGARPRRGYTARIWLLRASWVSWAIPRASSSGGRYIPNRPR